MSKGQVVIVTNVKHYVGPAVVERLRRDGARVVVQDASFADNAAREEFQRLHAGLLVLAAQTPKEIVDATLAAHDRIDAVVSNDEYPAIRAGVETAELADFRAGLETMLVRPFALAQAVVPSMKRQKGGRLVFVTSAAPLRGIPNYSMYAAARGGANALALTLAKELSPHGIVVNAIAPNYVENPSYFPPDLLADPQAHAKIVRNIPLGRLGKPEEVAALISFFAIGDCEFVTGHVVPVAGGWA
jgi:NAD(P)-dependent dehydrogenase (short-subunit alcohol dehydrogenase family)